MSDMENTPQLIEALKALDAQGLILHKARIQFKEETWFFWKSVEAIGDSLFETLSKEGQI